MNHPADQLAAKAGQRPDAVRCPGELPGMLGATMTYTLTASGVQHLVDQYVRNTHPRLGDVVTW